MRLQCQVVASTVILVYLHRLFAFVANDFSRLPVSIQKKPRAVHWRVRGTASGFTVTDHSSPCFYAPRQVRRFPCQDVHVVDVGTSPTNGCALP